MQEKEELEMDHCEETEVHEELLRIVQEKLPKEEELYDLAELYKVFGDSTRIRILFVLFEAEVCVCDLAAALQMTQSAISHQLRILKQNKLVKSRREGKSIFYSWRTDMFARSSIRDWNISRRIEPILLSERKHLNRSQERLRCFCYRIGNFVSIR